jgi:hypothetical protein
MKNYKTLKTIALVIFIAVLGIFAACNKTKQGSNRLMGHHWDVEEFTIDGVANNELYELDFEDCSIYKETCEGHLMTREGGEAHFAWQIRDKGKIFELSDQSDHSHGEKDKRAIFLSASISGVYQIDKQTRKEFEISSTETAQYKGKKVVIKMHKH